MEIIRDPSKTFADEWGVRDLILTPSEVSRVLNIAHAFGLPIGHHPTGRTVQLLLQHLQAIALREMSNGRPEYTGAFLAARQALGKAHSRLN